MEGLFMRGEIDLDDRIGVFMAARQPGGVISILYEGPDVAPSVEAEVSGAQTKTYAVFASVGYAQDDPTPKIVHIKKTGKLDKDSNPTFTMTSNLTPGGPAAPVASMTFKNKQHILDVSNDPNAQPTAWNIVGKNVDHSKIYTGIWYKMRTEGVTVQSWKVLATQGNSGPFKGATGDPIPGDTNFEVMFIPKDAGQAGSIFSWVENQCLAPQAGANVSMVLFTGWVNGDENAPVGCTENSWLIGKKAIKGARGCVFSSEAECNKGYLYTYCDQGSNCGPCLGVCPKSANPDDPTQSGCQHDFTQSIEDNGTSPLTCNPKEPEEKTFWQKYGIIILIVGIVLFVVAIIIVIVVVRLFRGGSSGSG